MKGYSTAPYDTVICAWCTNPFTRTKEQADRGVRYCERLCANRGNSIKFDDAHYQKMARAARRAYSRNRAERLAKRLAGKTLEQAYVMGRKDVLDERRGARRTA